MKKFFTISARLKLKTDPELFKKLTDEIWEFRTLYQGLQYLILAFWDKTPAVETLGDSNTWIYQEKK